MNKNIFYNLRRKYKLTQDALAEKLFVTRQAVSRWENGETLPNHETLKELSKLYNVSINTLLGSPNRLICQCCGMPMEDDLLGRNQDGSMNEEYCKWCYADGTYTYHDMDDLIDVCIKQMANEQFSEEQARAYMEGILPNLKYWKNHADLGNEDAFEQLKKELIEEINALGVKGMPKLTKLNALVGRYVNLEYELPSGLNAKFLDDNATYLGNQLESEEEKDRCYGVLANLDFLLICTYGKEGSDPDLLLFKKR